MENLVSEIFKKYMEAIKSISLSETIEIKAKGVILRFIIHYTKKSDEGFMTTVEDFPDLINHGETFEEARNYTLFSLSQRVHY